MKKNNNYAIVLGGGSGTRLWPLSRKNFPKQFTSLLGNETLLQITNRRLVDIFDGKIVYIVGREHVNNTKNQILEQGLDHNPVIIAEPLSRNTAPAILIGVLYIKSICSDAVMHVFPSDHLITGTQKLEEALDLGSKYASDGYLVTYGVKPHYPETGYGYIRQGAKLDKFTYTISNFCEKPDSLTARKFIDEGSYLWNTGIFTFKGSSSIAEYKKYSPEIFEILGRYPDNPDILTEKVFSTLPDVSFDKAIMENTGKGLVISTDFQWSDLGSWKSVYEFCESDENGNHLEGKVIANKTTSCYVRSENRLVVVNDIHNMVVVDTDDALYISPVESSSGIKDIIEDRENVEEFILPATVNKPWGYFIAVFKSDSYCIKRIVVRPGARLSLQKHQNRSENWTVVKGRANIIRDKEKFVLGEGGFVYIPPETLHRLENRGNCDLEVIEIQFGTDISEDDITRIEDDYGRVNVKESGEN